MSFFLTEIILKMSTFFSLSLNPSLSYTTILEDDLVLTRAVIDPDALDGSAARLLMKNGNREVALCQLSASYTTAPLNIELIASKSKISFRVAGDTPIHISGYYPPKNEEKEKPKMDAFDLGDSK